MVTCVHFQSRSSLQLLPGAQARMMQLQGKLREASNSIAGGIFLEQKQLQILHPGPLIAIALRSHPLCTCCPRFRCSVSVLFLCSQLGCLVRAGLQGTSTLPQTFSPSPNIIYLLLSPHRAHCKLSLLCGISVTLYDFFFLFRAAPAAYGSSLARGQIGAVAAGLHHSYHNARSELHLWCCSLWHP